PRAVSFCVSDPLDLVEARDRVAHVLRVDERLFAFLGKGKLRVGQVVLLRGAQPAAESRRLGAARACALRLAGLLKIAAGGGLLLSCWPLADPSSHGAH